MKKFSQLALPYIIWSIIILLLPVLLIAFYAVTDSGNTVVNFSFTLQNFAKFFTDHDFLLILWRSLSIALKTTIICILLGYPTAYFISRCKDRTRNILILLITLFRYMISSLSLMKISMVSCCEGTRQAYP